MGDANAQLESHMKKRRATILGTTVLIILVLFAGCGAGSEANGQAGDDTGGESQEEGVRADGVFRIVATTTQASDLTRILADRVPEVEITALMGAGVDPHLYQPTESDVNAMNQADMVVYSGLHLEGQFDAVFEALGERGVVVYALSRAPRRAGLIVPTKGESDSDDPHFWFDPRNWQTTTQAYAQLLAEEDPDHAGTYAGNAADYVGRLDLLYNWANTGMRSVPEQQRSIVTSHDAFQYFGAAFGWTMEAIQGISTEDEAGVGDIQGTVDLVMERNIPVLFVESSIPPDTIEAVIEAIRSEGGSARIGIRELYSDAMGVPGTFGGTYVGMIAENVLTILQSYRAAGVDVVIPEWPEGLEPQPPQELFE